MRWMLPCIAGVGVASLVLGAAALVDANAAQAACFESQRAYSAWRADYPSASLDGSLVPSCTDEGVRVQVARGVTYAGGLLLTALSTSIAWGYVRSRPSPAH